MADYLFLVSRDPLTTPEVTGVLQTATQLANDGAKVTLCLIQNGVFAARAKATGLTKNFPSNVTLVADDESLSERGITQNELRSDLKTISMDAIVDAMMSDSTKTIWH